MRGSTVYDNLKVITGSYYVQFEWRVILAAGLLLIHAAVVAQRLEAVSVIFSHCGEKQLEENANAIALCEYAFLKWSN